MPTMISTVLNSSKNKTLAIVGDFNRTREHYHSILKFLRENDPHNRVTLFDFMSQSDLRIFLGQCRIFVWPNIKPENPFTTTNRSVIEALACGLPLLFGERAFNETEFVVSGYNGYLYNSDKDFREKSDEILDNLDFFRSESVKVNRERFSFQENFINFYNKLYSL